MVPQELYLCQRCGNCCRWPGAVRLREVDIRRLAVYLGMGEREFIEEFTEIHADRSGLALKNQADGACIFLVGRNECRVHEAKPGQCRAFPNGWNFPGWRQVCEAVPDSEVHRGPNR